MSVATTGSVGRRFVSSVAGALTLLACSDDPGARIDAAVLPKGDAFQPVAEMMVAQCGSLDCHGSKYRNMRLYGFGSGRLPVALDGGVDPSIRPDTPGRTTPEEAALDYDAIVSVEPEMIRVVAAERGRAPERLTFVRKGRNAEDHKGGQRLFVGGNADNCLMSWLAGAVDTKVCQAALVDP